MQIQQVAQVNEVANFANLIKSAVGIFYVYLVFLLCYLPYLISLVVTEIKGSGIVLKRFSLLGFTLAYLNSSLNPVIYCWKMRHIRQAVINVLRNMCRHRNHTSHETLEMTGHTKNWTSVVHAVKRLTFMTTTAERFNSGCSSLNGDAQEDQLYSLRTALWVELVPLRLKNANVIYFSQSKNQNRERICELVLIQTRTCTLSFCRLFFFFYLNK